MKYDKNLIKLIEDKKFKTFWHCLDYLLVAGYSAIDAFGISLKQFGEGKIFSSVAFIRMEKWDNHIILGIDHHDTPARRPFLIVGLIDDSNIHLDGLYTVYRGMITNGLTSSPEIEETCEVIKSSQLTPVIIHYLLNHSEKHFGVKSFVIPKQITIDEEPDEPRPTDSEIRAIMKRLETDMRGKKHPDPNDEYNGWPPMTREQQQDARIIDLSQALQRKRNSDLA